jgi:hypothetical protein
LHLKHHPESFTNTLREANFSDEDIQRAFDRKQPLDFTSLQAYEECVKDLEDVRKTIERRTGVKNLRCVQQGSSIPGFSTNPNKGHRYLPNYLTDRVKSDTDLRFSGDGMKEYIEKVRLEGKTVNVKKYAPHLIDNYDGSNGILFPELEAMAKKWVDDKRVYLTVQFTIFEEYKPYFEPGFWDNDLLSKESPRALYALPAPAAAGCRVVGIAINADEAGEFYASLTEYLKTAGLQQLVGEAVAVIEANKDLADLPGSLSCFFGQKCV